MRSPHKTLGLLLAISLLAPITAIHAVPVGCSSTSSTTGTRTKLTFASTGACTWTVPSGVNYMKVLIVAGGGGGGGGAFGGGGGGGAVITSTSIPVTSGSVFNIEVGAGGTGGTNSLTATNANSDNAAGENGGDSSVGNLIAKGGGGGGGYVSGTSGDRSKALGLEGGNRGGGSENSSYQGWQDGTTSQLTASSLNSYNRIQVFGNFTGGNTSDVANSKAGGGGGGSGENGVRVVASSKGGNGGVGVAASLSGTSRFYGGGGGGGGSTLVSPNSAGIGGNGGGGNGGLAGDGSAGEVNSGGGGGGAGYDSTPRFGGNGGSGLVVITYTANTCLENESCSVGEEGPAGGYVFYIDTATNTAYEAAPEFWQGSCAAGGLCNMGDVGAGGGWIYSVDGTSYLEISPWSMESTYRGMTGEESALFHEPSVAELRQYFKNRLRPELRAQQVWVSDMWYQTTDYSNGSSVIYNPITDESMEVNPNTLNQYFLRPVAYRVSGDTQGYLAPFNDSLPSLSDAIGSGPANTQALAAVTDLIADVAEDLSLNGKTDWFLPSGNEMKKLALKAQYIEQMSGYGTEYWTSSSPGAPFGYVVDVNNPNTLIWTFQDYIKQIRPIRTFAVAAPPLPGVSIAMNSGRNFATFRTANSITATSTEAGRVTFYADGKKISGCISIATSSNVASCSWKPSVRKAVRLTAILKTSSSSYSTIYSVEVSVVSRTTLR